MRPCGDASVGDPLLGFRDIGPGDIHRGDEGVRAVLGQGDGLCANTACGFENVGSVWVGGASVKRLNEGWGMVLEADIFSWVVAV